jgi:maltose alpha-D-glucosyltransferase / alpha-amylase
VDERWYKNGLVYEVSVRAFADSNGDGIGDLRGLADRLDYVGSLGVSCIWLLPFYPSPWRDGGYDVTDHYGVHADLGTLGDFVELTERAAARGMRVVIDLVLNHTSDEHPWFQAARTGHPVYKDYYVWADRKPEDAESGVVFPGVQKTTWSYDRKARRYYFHRFYDFQPDLNIANPAVREEMRRIMAFWLEVGAAGFRVDAVPFLIEPAGVKGARPGPEFEHLHELRNALSWRRGDAVLLGEANVERDAIQDYFGVGGMHMLFNFMVNQNVWLALARSDARPLVQALERTAGIPASDQWANFLRNHDEIDLGRLAPDESADVFEAFGPERKMQLYDRGIRRRLAPMLGGDRARLELAFSLLLTLPGTPVVFYGDELGMGDDLSLPERRSVRTAMQWTGDGNGGFSTAPRRELGVPVIGKGPFRYASVNVADADRDPGSLLNWLRWAVAERRQRPEFGEGDWDALDADDPSILALRYRHQDRETVVLHNLSASERRAALGKKKSSRGRFVDTFANRPYDAPRSGRIELDAHGYRWLRSLG